MPMKLLLSLSAVIAAGAVAAAVVIVTRPFGTSTAGGLPTTVAIDPARFTPAPAGTSRPARGAASISAEAAMRVLTENLSPGQGITPGTVQATLKPFGDLSGDFTALGSVRARYAGDYPVWVVTASGAFTELSSSGPLGAPPQKFIQMTLYIDGYNGTVISRTLVSATPTAGERAAMATEQAQAYRTPVTPPVPTSTPPP